LVLHGVLVERGIDEAEVFEDTGRLSALPAPQVIGHGNRRE